MGFSPFMETSSRPVRGMTLSLGVCQCQGTMQPGVKFISMTEGPLPGSPFKAASEAQSGKSGAVANFADMPLLTTAVAGDSCAEAVRTARKIVARKIVFIGGSVWCRDTLVVLEDECQWRARFTRRRAISRVGEAAGTLG